MVLLLLEVLDVAGLLVLLELGRGRDRDGGVVELLLDTLLLLSTDVTLEHCWERT